MATAGVTSKISQEMTATSAPEADQDESLLEGNPAAVAGSNRQATIFWFGALMLVSVWMTVGNKIIMTDFHYPNLELLVRGIDAHPTEKFKHHIAYEMMRSNFERRGQILGRCTRGAKKGERVDLCLQANAIAGSVNMNDFGPTLLALKA